MRHFGFLRPYAGRASRRCRHCAARLRVIIDIGFSDAIEPGLTETDLPVLLDLPAPELGGREGTAGRIRTALETAGVEFIDENGGSPGVRLRKRQPNKS
jgi:hypothetical protein